MKDQLATTALREIERIPAAKPPYQEATTTAGKKKMKGNSCGPTTAPSDALAASPAETQAKATRYRAQVGRLAGGLVATSKLCKMERSQRMWNCQIRGRNILAPARRRLQRPGASMRTA